MQLPHTLDSFRQQDWERVFGAFVAANKSHWRGAPYEAVMNLLRAKGRFEFTVTGMNTWTNKFVLQADAQGRLDVSLVPNPELPQMMQKHLAQMQERFEQELRAK